MKVVTVVMLVDPELARRDSDNDVLTVYKDPRTHVQSITCIDDSYSVVLHIPEDCYDEILKSLQEEILIMEIDGVPTNLGQRRNRLIMEMNEPVEPEGSGNFCRIS